MKTLRVWLPMWEWDCCGEIIVEGSRQVFQVDYLPSPPGPRYSELARLNVDAVESHHEYGGAHRIEGVVAATHGVEDGRLLPLTRVPWPPRFGEHLPEPTAPIPRYDGYLIDLHLETH